MLWILTKHYWYDCTLFLYVSILFCGLININSCFKKHKKMDKPIKLKNLVCLNKFEQEQLFLQDACGFCRFCLAQEKYIVVEFQCSWT